MVKLSINWYVCLNFLSESIYFFQLPVGILHRMPGEARKTVKALFGTLPRSGVPKFERSVQFPVHGSRMGHSSTRGALECLRLGGLNAFAQGLQGYQKFDGDSSSVRILSSME